MTKYFFSERKFLVFPFFSSNQFSKKLIWRNFCEKTVAIKFWDFQNVHTVEKQKNFSHRKNISSNHLFSNFFSKYVGFTKFFPKYSESKFQKVPHCAVEITEIYSHTFLTKIRESNLFTKEVTKELISRKKFDEIEFRDFSHCAFLNWNSTTLEVFYWVNFRSWIFLAKFTKSFILCLVAISIFTEFESLLV